ncbi:tripartite tricarboxylate transporter TctB family protein [Alkalihalobacillus sp. BA299]|uniref:tripartite tricarboxylate transporter TctB family protein n=1 Tax=Alkalihalobacillus sp. BA299 TaxID=2815938 RepID=UPI001ADCD7C9|nr:tripartite tricarboxylate transporter TctB family protein [Alkalihalobacillus sp. BA299]
MVRLIMPIFFFIIGVGFLIGSLNLPKAKLGDPNGPLYFPILICILLTILSLVYFFQEWKVRRKEIEEVKLLVQGRTPKLIISTVILILIYTFLFERIGFLFSTVIFLGGLLFAVNGKKRWLQNILVSVLFSFISWYMFAKLLQVSLP